jgi:hypothetical protein
VPTRRQVSGWGTALVGLAGLLAAPFAGPQLGILAVTTSLAVGAGAEAHARLHPRFGSSWGRRLDGFWIGPAFAALTGAFVSGLVEGPVGRLAAVGGAFVIGALLRLQDRELDGRTDSAWGPLAYALLLYVVAFALFVLLYGLHDPLWLIAFATGGGATLLAAALFRPSRAVRTRTLLFAALVGLAVAELTLALGGWLATGLLGGAFLLLFFYVAAGLLQALLDGALDRRLMLEYVCVGLVGLALILSTSPWRG